MAPAALLYMPPGQLARYISHKHVIPGQARSEPWVEDGNVILITDKNAYKTHKRVLAAHSEEFAKKIETMNDGNTDVVEHCAVLEVPFAAPADLAHFLAALHRLDTPSPPAFPLATLGDFGALAGTLRVATLTKTAGLRTRAIAALEARYPTTLAGWDAVRRAQRLDDWDWERTLIVNLAREVGAFSILPAAMAMLTDDCSAGEVFGVRLPTTASPTSPMTPTTPTSPRPTTPTSPMTPTSPRPQAPPPLNDADAPSFALLKEHNHRSLLALLLAIRALGAACTRPPDLVPPNAGLAPVGSALLRPPPSQCSPFFKHTAARLLESQVLLHPVGYAQFLADLLLRVPHDRRRTCTSCWREFARTCNDARHTWWADLPRVLGFESGWADERLRCVVV